MKQGFSEAEILELVRRRGQFFVHKYAWGQDALRKKCRRMAKDGKLVLIQRTRDGFYYEVPKDG